MCFKILAKQIRVRLDMPWTFLGKSWRVGSASLFLAAFPLLAQSTAPLKVELQAGQDGQLNARTADSADPNHVINKDSEDIQKEGLKFAFTKNGGSMELSGPDRPLEIRFNWIADAILNAPQGLSVTFQGSEKHSSVLIQIPDQPTVSKATLHLPDGAEAEMGAGSAARLQVMLDGTYFIKGAFGILLTDADGKQKLLNKMLPPHSGGPLKTATNEGGMERFERANSRIRVRLYGNPGEVIGIEAGEQFVELAPGIRESLSFSNGASLSVSSSPDGKDLEWFVDSGYFDVGLDQIPAWNAHLTTGQRAGMEWKNEIKTVDIFNRSEEENIIVALPSRTYASVAPGAHLQTTILSSSMFASAATGEAALYNQLNGKETDLTDRNLIFRAGEAMADSGNFDRSEQLVNLTWDIGKPLVLDEIPEPLTLLPDREEIVNVTSKHQLSVQYANQGQLSLEALKGNYRLVISALNGLEIIVQEGDVLTMSLDINKGTFVLTAAESNFSDLTVKTPDGSAQALQPSDAMNFNIGDNGFILATNSRGESIFFEGAGADNAFTPIGTIVGGGDLGQVPPIDVDRLPEAIASPARVN